MPRLENMTDEQLSENVTRLATVGELQPCEIHALWENCECWKTQQAQALADAKAEELRQVSEEKRGLLKNVDEFRTAVARMAQRIDDSELQAIDRAALTNALAGIVISVGMEELVGGW